MEAAWPPSTFLRALGSSRLGTCSKWELWEESGESSFFLFSSWCFRRREGRNFPLTPKQSLPSNRYKMEPGFHVLEQADCFRGDARSRGQRVSECEKPWDRSNSRTVRERWRQAGVGMSGAAGRVCCTARLTSKPRQVVGQPGQAGPREREVPETATLSQSPETEQAAKLAGVPGGTPNCVRLALPPAAVSRGAETKCFPHWHCGRIQTVQVRVSVY